MAVVMLSALLCILRKKIQSCRILIINQCGQMQASCTRGGSEQESGLCQLSPSQFPGQQIHLADAIL